MDALPDLHLVLVDMRVRDLVLVCSGKGQWKSWDMIRCMDGEIDVARTLFSEN
jgi:hypothetical protein